MVWGKTLSRWQTSETGLCPGGTGELQRFQSRASVYLHTAKSWQSREQSREMITDKEDRQSKAWSSTVPGAVEQNSGALWMGLGH